MTRAAWLEWRRGGIGSSDIRQIALPPHLRPYREDGPWRVWRSKVEPVPADEPSPTPRMQMGQRIERWILECAAEDLGGELAPGEPQEHPDEPWMRCSPDGWLIREGQVEAEGIEAKLVVRGEAAWSGEAAPPWCTIQAAWCAMVTDAPRWHMVAYLPLAGRLAYYIYERDAATEGRLRELARAWWARHVVGGEPPEVDESADAAAWLAAHHTGGEARTASADEAEVIADWRAAVDAAAEARRLRARVIEAMQGCDEMITPAGVARYRAGRLTWRTSDER